MFVALDKLQNQELKQAIIVVPEKSIGSNFNDDLSASSAFGLTGVWSRNGTCAMLPALTTGQVKSVRAFLESGDKVLVCTHATFRFAVDPIGWRRLTTD